jgi:hypothetical protein
MKIVSVNGCVVDSLEVDGKEFSDYTNEEKVEILHNIIDSLDDYDLFSTLSNIVENIGEYEDLGYCDICGDRVSKFSAEIDLCNIKKG